MIIGRERWLRAAQASAGCRWLVAETQAERPGHPVTSFRDMMRVGITPRYERPNWQWRPDRAHTT